MGDYVDGNAENCPRTKVRKVSEVSIIKAGTFVAVGEGIVGLGVTSDVEVGARIEAALSVVKHNIFVKKAGIGISFGGQNIVEKRIILFRGRQTFLFQVAVLLRHKLRLKILEGLRLSCSGSKERLQ